MLRASSKPLFRIPEKKRAVNPYTPRLEPSRSLAGRIEVPAPNAAASFETKPSRECLHTPKKDQHRRKNYRNHDTAWQSVLGWTFPVHHRERKHAHICVHYPLASEPNLCQNLDHKMRLTLCDAPRLTKSITPMETGCWTKAEGQNFAKIQCRSICIGGGCQLTVRTTKASNEPAWYNFVAVLRRTLQWFRSPSALSCINV